MMHKYIVNNEELLVNFDNVDFFEIEEELEDLSILNINIRHKASQIKYPIKIKLKKEELQKFMFNKGFVKLNKNFINTSRISFVTENTKESKRNVKINFFFQNGTYLFIEEEKGKWNVWKTARLT